MIDSGSITLTGGKGRDGFFSCCPNCCSTDFIWKPAVVINEVEEGPLSTRQWCNSCGFRFNDPIYLKLLEPVDPSTYLYQGQFDYYNGPISEPTL